jgi:hypothetical protein
MNKTIYIILGILTIVIITGLYIRHHIKTELTKSLERKTEHLKNPLGIDIWCKNKPNPKQHLQALFPEIQFFEWGFTTEAPKGFDKNNPKHSVYFIKDHSTENALYPFEISLEYLDRKIWTYTHIYQFAKRIAAKENNTCLVEYINPEALDSPYYSLLFTEKGKIYLVDDSEYDNEKNDVTIIKKLKSIYD